MVLTDKTAVCRQCTPAKEKAGFSLQRRGSLSLDRCLRWLAPFPLFEKHLAEAE